RYSVLTQSVFALTATVTDAEHTGGQLRCEWLTILHHNDHTHAEPVDTNCTSTTVISPTPCDLDSYHYRIKLTVTDVLGLTGTDEVLLYPDCRAGMLTFGSRDNSGNIVLRIAGVTAGMVTVEASSNLLNWATVASPTNDSGTLSFNDPDAQGMQVRFYRARYNSGIDH
ncbi:MAG TPA: hypothetical protein VK530_01425, partial [Candidatus Acidoferrum sp.]|nr:hypothetical protein [Candidatus Acidoferrum sp.]